MKQFIHEGVTYDVSELPEEAQQAFDMLAYVTNTRIPLENQLNTLTAAGKVFTDMVVAKLHKDAIVEIETDEPELPDSEEYADPIDTDWRVD